MNRIEKSPAQFESASDFFFIGVLDFEWRKRRKWFRKYNRLFWIIL